MKLTFKLFLESVDTSRRSISSEEIMDNFMDHVQVMDARQMRSLLQHMLKMANVGVDVSEINDPKVLVSMIGNTANKLEDNEEFNEFLISFLELDDVHPPG